ncbi:hypothetical protein [Flagellimonas iocasae]|uniref:Lipoprotein n=1 Tax=Flagellimonas iocasae TaxID=2055905 RepID=A0ABW4Y186_9FLAO
MMQHRIKGIYLFIVLGCFAVLSGCRNSYEDIVQNELESGVVKDSLWYGIKFKMTRQQFEEDAFEMNQRGLFKESGLGLMELKFPDEFKYPVDCEFYPEFKNEIIVGMSGRFNYMYWNGFNRDYDNIVLLKELLPKMETWFQGGEFLEMDLKEPASRVGPVYVKVDGNRELRVWNDINLEHVNFSIMDLTAIQD